MKEGSKADEPNSRYFFLLSEVGKFRVKKNFQTRKKVQFFFASFFYAIKDFKNISKKQSGTIISL